LLPEIINEFLPKAIPELVKKVVGIQLIDIREWMGGSDINK
jgi:hypothetical protein